MLIAFMALLLTLSLGACAYLQHPKFGAYPEGERLAKALRSPGYADGEFRNLLETPMLLDGNNTFSIITGDLLRKIENLRPNQPIPAIKTDLKALDMAQDAIV